MNILKYLVVFNLLEHAFCAGFSLSQLVLPEASMEHKVRQEQQEVTAVHAVKQFNSL